MVKAKAKGEALSDSSDDLLLDDEMIDKDDMEVYIDDWGDEENFLRQERAAEFSQIESFLQQTLMVRCERYNANITSLGCFRKKESPPPKLKNSQGPEEENIQNHPCFGCIGPILVNWPIQDPPVALHEVEERPVIVHPGIEDDFSIARERQIEAYREQHTGTSYSVDVPKPEELPSYQAQFIKYTSENEDDFFLEEEEDSPIISVVQESRRSTNKSKPPKAEKKKTKPATEAKELTIDSSVLGEALGEAIPKAEPTQEIIEEIVELKPKKKKKTSASTKKKASKKKVAKAKEKPSAESGAEEHPPCASCGKVYELPHSKYWRGDICNPCYAKRLRKRKKKGGTTKTKAKAKVTRDSDHPPCESCGRAYEPPYSKYWRGDICNPCYAKRLRKRRQNKDDSVQSNA